MMAMLYPHKAAECLRKLEALGARAPFVEEGKDLPGLSRLWVLHLGVRGDHGAGADGDDDEEQPGDGHTLSVAGAPKSDARSEGMGLG